MKTHTLKDFEIALEQLELFCEDLFPKESPVLADVTYIAAVVR